MYGYVSRTLEDSNTGIKRSLSMSRYRYITLLCKHYAFPFQDQKITNQQEVTLKTLELQDAVVNVNDAIFL